MNLTTLALLFRHLSPGKRASLLKDFISFLKANTKTFTLTVAIKPDNSKDIIYASMKDDVFRFGTEDTMHPLSLLTAKKAQEYEEILLAFVQAAFESLEKQITGLLVMDKVDDREIGRS